MGTLREESSDDFSDLDEKVVKLLRLLARGLTNSELADALGVSVSTVKNRLHCLFRIFEVSDRGALIQKASEKGLIILPR